MEVRVKKVEPKFLVTTLEIDIQCQEELDFFDALFDCEPVTQVMRDHAKAAAGQIVSALTRSGGVDHGKSAEIRKQLHGAFVAFNS